MSNYELEAANPNHTIYVGWDPMWNTYFIHVIDESAAEDSGDYDVIWIGTSFGEVRDIEVINDVAKKYTKKTYGIPTDIWTRIYSEANN